MSYSSSSSSSSRHHSSRDGEHSRDRDSRDRSRDGSRSSDRDRDSSSSHRDRDYRSSRDSNRDTRDRDSYSDKRSDRDSYKDSRTSYSSSSTNPTTSIGPVPPSNGPIGPAPPPSSSSSYPSSTSSKSRDDDGWESAKAPASSSDVDPFSNIDPANTGIDFDKYDSIPVEVSGRDPPAAITSWKDVGEIDRQIVENIEKARYTKPTPVQKNSIPIVMAGRDLMGCAQTGSGKTAAFLVPTIGIVLKNGRNRPKQGDYRAAPAILILAPTRELACQIHEEALKFAFRTGLRANVVYGGTPMGQQLRELRGGTDILVATPGRLNDMFARRAVTYSCVSNLILDEADRMLDMGFEPQIREIVEKSDMAPTGVRQTLMFSATFAKEIQQLASTFLADYVFLAVGRVGATAEMVTQKFVEVNEYDKETALLNCLRDVGNGLTLIFVETKRKVVYLDQFLRRNGFACTSIHGDREQFQRTAAIKSFSSGDTPILIATNVAARGLDISNITNVINVDMANNIDDYVHRIGRTGRAGKRGTSITFITPTNSALVPKLCDILEDAKQEIPAFMAANRGRREFKTKKFGGKDFRNKAGGHAAYSNNGHGGQSSYGSQSGGYGGHGGHGGHSNSYGSQSNGYGAHSSGYGANNHASSGGYGGYGAQSSSSYAPPAHSGGYGANNYAASHNSYNGSSYAPAAQGYGAAPAPYAASASNGDSSRKRPHGDDDDFPSSKRPRDSDSRSLYNPADAYDPVNEASSNGSSSNGNGSSGYGYR